MKRLSVARVVAMLVCALAGWASDARADAVTYWNEIAVRAVTIGRPSPVGFLDLALVQAAVHDAVQAFERRYEAYHAAIDGATGSPEAAVAAAAHGVLAGLYPAQRTELDRDYLQFLEARGLAGNPGIVAGEQAAAALLTQYRAAPNPPLPPYRGGTEIGMWRPTPSDLGNPPSPPPYADHALVYLASVVPFTLHAASQFRPQPPPSVQSGRYRRDYDEVKAYGARFSTVRTPGQTDMAYFWSDNVVTQWSRTLREIAEQRLTRLGDSARLFALAYLATADALIACWDAKLHYSYWRPITAIHEGDEDGNPKTAGDPSWQPLLNTPNYADYPSGANNVSGVMTSVIERVFGTDEVAFTVTSNAPNVVQRTRAYARTGDAAREVVDARMYLGFHFRFADEEALRQGTRVAHWTFTRYLRPLPRKEK